MRSARLHDAVHRQFALAGAHIDDVEPRAANARRMQRLQVAPGRRVGNHRDTAERRPRGRQGGEQGGIVGTVETRLHQHRARAAERRQQFLIGG